MPEEHFERLVTRSTLAPRSRRGHTAIVAGLTKGCGGRCVSATLALRIRFTRDISDRRDNAMLTRHSYSSWAAEVTRLGRTRTQTSNHFASCRSCFVRLHWPLQTSQPGATEVKLREGFSSTCSDSVIVGKRVICASDNEFGANRLPVTHSRGRDAGRHVCLPTQ